METEEDEEEEEEEEEMDSKSLKHPDIRKADIENHSTSDNDVSFQDYITSDGQSSSDYGSGLVTFFLKIPMKCSLDYI